MGAFARPVFDASMAADRRGPGAARAGRSGNRASIARMGRLGRGANRARGRPKIYRIDRAARTRSRAMQCAPRRFPTPRRLYEGARTRIGVSLVSRGRIRSGAMRGVRLASTGRGSRRRRCFRRRRGAGSGRIRRMATQSRGAEIRPRSDMRIDIAISERGYFGGGAPRLAAGWFGMGAASHAALGALGNSRRGFGRAADRVTPPEYRRRLHLISL